MIVQYSGLLLQVQILEKLSPAKISAIAKFARQENDLVS